MIRRRTRVFQYLTFLILLTLPTIARGGTSGWVQIDSPVAGYTATHDFPVEISYSLTQHDNLPCPDGEFRNWATFYLKLDDRNMAGFQLDSWHANYPFGELNTREYWISIGGLDPAKLHTITVSLQDEYYVQGQGCIGGDFFAQDTLTFRVCNGSTDPCCKPNPDICCFSGNECCGSSDPCCGHEDDPCCKNPKDPCCVDKCCGNHECCPPPPPPPPPPPGPPPPPPPGPGPDGNAGG